MKNLRLCLAFVLLFSASVAKAQTRAHYINVGQADSILLEFRTAAILIDAGGETTVPANRDRDHLVGYLNRFFAERAANPSLPNLNRTLLAVIITSPAYRPYQELNGGAGCTERGVPSPEPDRGWR